MTAAERMLDSLKPYPAYKDSGVEWLGRVPETWKTEPIKKGYTIQLGKMLQPQPSSDASMEVEYLRAANVQDGWIDAENPKTMFMSPSENAKFSIGEGDLLILEGGDIGRSALVTADHAGLAIQNSLHRVRGAKSDTRFLHYAMQHVRSTGLLDVLCNKATIQHLTGDKLAALVIAQPQADEQAAIAAFLDHETAYIDELVREQEQLLEDLKLKRLVTSTSVILHGLNPAVPTKDSGVAWIGTIPSHWEVAPMKHVLRALDQGWSPECENRPADAGEWGVLKLSAVSSGRFLPDEHKTLPSNMDPQPELNLQRGDVLVTRANTRTLVGATALVTMDQPMLMMSDLIYRLRTIKERYSPAYLTAILQSPVGRTVIELNANGTSHTMVKIPRGVLLNMPVPLPPLDEQVEIIAYLNERLVQIDRLVLEVRENIEDMKLLRSTLITAATTGKIDVRDWRPA